MIKYYNRQNNENHGMENGKLENSDYVYNIYYQCLKSI